MQDDKADSCETTASRFVALEDIVYTTADDSGSFGRARSCLMMADDERDRNDVALLVMAGKNKVRNGCRRRLSALE